MITAPNTTSIFVSGSNVNLTWAYSEHVTMTPTSVEVKYASDSNAVKNLWTVISTVPGTQTWLVWTIPQSSATDKFVLRLVPDGKETIRMGIAGNAPCFGDGMVMPTVRCTKSDT